MIEASADQIAQVLAGDAELMRDLHNFLGAVLGDDGDVAEVLEDLPKIIAGFSPFENEAALIAIVKRETLELLHALALHRLPARGNA